MAKKKHLIGFKASPELKDKPNGKVIELGILTRTGKPNISRCLRWFVVKGHYPLCREKYADLKKNNLDLIKVGSLVNQTLHLLHREIVILNDKGYEDKNSQTTLKELTTLRGYYESLKIELDQQKKTLQQIVNIEGV